MRGALVNSRALGIASTSISEMNWVCYQVSSSDVHRKVVDTANQGAGFTIRRPLV